MENITPLFEAIRKSEKCEEFFSNVVEFLKEYCKKIEIIWIEKERDKVRYAKKVGRKKIEIGELEKLPEMKEEGGYRIYEIQTDNLEKLLLKVKLKRKTSDRKFQNIAEIIGKGTDIAFERFQSMKKREELEREVEQIKGGIMNIAELSKTISECEPESTIKKTFEIAEELGAENSILITNYPEKKRFIFKEDEDLERKAEEIISQETSENELKPKREKTEDGKILDIFPISLRGRYAGTLIIKHQIGELPFWFEKVIPLFIFEMIAHRDKELEKEKSLIFDILNELNIGVAIFSKEKTDTPTFRNEKFQEYISKIPSIEQKIKEDITLSINFRTETMRKVEIDGQKFLISTHATKNDKEILLELIELKENI